MVKIRKDVPKTITNSFSKSAREQVHNVNLLSEIIDNNVKINAKDKIKFKYWVYESGIVRLYSEWEDYIEKMFYTFIVNALPKELNVMYKIIVSEEDDLKSLVTGSRSYAPWSDIDSVLERAAACMHDIHPFISSINHAKNDVKRVNIIRNKCAHKSAKANVAYEKMLKEVYGVATEIDAGQLLSNAPAKGLSSAKDANKYNTVLELYQDILISCAKGMIK